MTASSKINNCDAEDMKRFVNNFLEQISTLINGNVTFMDNMKVKILTFDFKSANQTIGIDHGLGAVPSGYFLVGSNAAVSVFDGIQINTGATIYLQANAVAKAKVMVFL